MSSRGATVVGFSLNSSGGGGSGVGGGVNNFLNGSGAAGEFIEAPDDASFDLSGDAEWRWGGKQTSDPGSRYWISRYVATGNHRHYRFYSPGTTNILTFQLGASDGTLRSTQTYTAGGDTNGVAALYRVRLDADNGSSNTAITWERKVTSATLFDAFDDDTNWADSEVDTITGVQSWQAEALAIQLCADGSDANIIPAHFWGFYHWGSIDGTNRICSLDVRADTQVTSTPPDYTEWTDDDAIVWTVQDAGMEYHYPVAGSCTATIDDPTTAGIQRDFEVTTVDNQSANFPYGGHTVAISITGPNAGNPTVTDVGDGTYTASDTPTAAITDAVTITFDSTEISGSPFAPDVVPAAVDAATCTATVDTPVNAGDSVAIEIQAKDQYGNNLTAGGDTFTVAVTGDNTATPTPTDNTDGTYSASYTATNAGEDTVTIQESATNVVGSPFTVTVNEVAALSEADSTATIAGGAPSVTAGDSVSITIQARDQFANAWDTGGDTVAISVSGANTATPSATDLDNGIYTASYTATNAGTDSITITINTIGISGSPFSLTVDPVSAQSRATIKSDGPDFVEYGKWVPSPPWS